MVTGKQLKVAILARRAAQGPRKKRTRPEPRQYTVADLERARDRVAAAERRIDNDRRSILNRDTRGWSGRTSNCLTSSRNYACAASSATMDNDDRGRLVPVIKLMWLLPAGGAPLVNRAPRWITRAGQRRCKSARGPKADRCSQSHFWARVARQKPLQLRDLYSIALLRVRAFTLAFRNPVRLAGADTGRRDGAK
jgi:hypothetical protein